MKVTPSWKRLLLQALDQAPLPQTGSRWNPLPALNWFRNARQQAGILQDFPLHSLRLSWLWWRSDDAQGFVDACHRAVKQAGEPWNLSPALLILPLLTAALLLPKTATTSITPSSLRSLLQQPIVAGLDHDQQSSSLPLASDYDRSAFRAVDDIFYRAGLHGSAWLATQCSEYYALQLMGASRPENLVRFCRQNGICRESLVIEAQVDGKRLWRLLIGRYPDRDSARAALDRLAAPLKALKPWPRSYASLQASQARQDTACQRQESALKLQD